MTFKLSLKERKSPHSMERHPRYDVMVGDQKVDQLYFNMTGYTGTLMDIHGTRILLGEKGISAWKKEVAAINREARNTMALNDTDPRRIEKVERTLDGYLRKLTFDDGSDMCVRDDHYRAGVELFGEDRLSPKFFEPQENRTPIIPGITIRTGEMWGSIRFGLKIFETSDPDQVAIATGYAPALTGKIIYGATDHKLPENWGLSDISGVFSELKDNWTAEMERIVFISRDTFDEIVEANGSDFLRSDILPGHGVTSEKHKVIGETITSTRARPDILMSSEELREYGEFISEQGYVAIERPDEAEIDAPEDLHGGGWF
jgi:hypothetical protein